MKSMQRLVIGLLALSLAGCVRPLVAPTVASPGALGPVGSLYESRLRVSVGAPRSVQTLPLLWSHVRLTVTSPKLHAPLVQEVATGGSQVAVEFMVPPGPASVTAEMLLSGQVVATGASETHIWPGATQGVEIVMTTSRVTVNTLSGLKAPYLGDGKPAVDMRLSYPSAMVFDAAGNLYVADMNHNRIRRIDAAPPHAVTTLAGHATPLSGPKSLAYDGLGNLYFTENASNKVYRLNLATGELTHWMNLPASHSLAYHAGFLYVSDPVAGRILKVDVATTALTEFVGNSAHDVGLTAILNAPQGLAVSPDGTSLYIAENGAHRVLKVDLAAKTMSTVAGNGTAGTPTAQGMPGDQVSITNPDGLTVGSDGTVYIAALYGHQVYRVDPTGALYTVAGMGLPGFSGDGGPATGAQLAHPGPVALAPDGSLYIGDRTNNRIRKVFGGAISTFAGNGDINFYGGDELAGIPFADAAFSQVERVAVDADGNVYVADVQNSRVRVLARTTQTRFGVNLVQGRVHTLIGKGLLAVPNYDTPAVTSPIGAPRGLALDEAGNLYVSDSAYNVIVKLDRATGMVTRVAGGTGSGYADGAGSQAMFSSPEGMAFSPGENRLYVADRTNHRVRMIDLATGNVSTFAGTGTAGSAADGATPTAGDLNWPIDVSVDDDRNVYIVDQRNHKVRMVCQTAGTYFGTPLEADKMYTVAGTGTGAYPGNEGVLATASPLNLPSGVELDHLGNLLIADTTNNRVRLVDRTTGVITALVGFQQGSADGLGGLGADFGVARLSSPWDVARGPSGMLYIADAFNFSIRQAMPSGL